MGSVIQWIIVGIIVGGAIVYFATRKKDSGCSGCPLDETCKKRRR